MATTLKVQRFVYFKLLGFGFVNHCLFHGLGRASHRDGVFQKGVNGLWSRSIKQMDDGKGRKKSPNYWKYQHD